MAERLTVIGASIVAVDRLTPNPKARLTVVGASVVAADIGNPPQVGLHFTVIGASVVAADTLNPQRRTYSYAMVIS